MSNEEQERIETHGNQRIKFTGSRIVAVEQTCFHCHQKYWQPVVPFSLSASQMSTAHQCSPDRPAGASVINKYG